MASGQDATIARSMKTLFEAGAGGGLRDVDLLGRYLAGEAGLAEAAFEALVVRHGPMVLSVCRDVLRDEHDAQDAFQATFLVMASKAGSIRRPESLASWLFGVARRVAGRARAEAATRRRREREAGLLAIHEEGPGREPEEFAALFEEIERLPRTHREPIILCYLRGLSYEDAARDLNCPLGTLSVRLKRAKERLRSRLGRRGVTIPAGLLAAGASTSAAKAVPPAMAGLAAKAAMRWIIDRPAIAGASPASSFVPFSGRRVSAMRWGMFGVGSLGLGAVVLMATASHARKGPENGGAAPQEVRKEPFVERPWVKLLPGGVIVELLAVSEHDGRGDPGEEPMTWRKPDGSPLAAPPYQRGGGVALPRNDELVHEFAVRATNLPKDAATFRWIVTPSGFNTVPGVCVTDGKVLPGMSMVSVAIAANRKACTVRFGVASAKWATEATGRPGGVWTKDQGPIQAIFGKAREVDGHSEIVVSYTDVPDEVRVIALDTEGREHVPFAWGEGAAGNFRQRDLQFDLPLARIREFRLQARPFAWAVFDDVALKPRP